MAQSDDCIYRARTVSFGAGKDFLEQVKRAERRAEADGKIIVEIDNTVFVHQADGVWREWYEMRLDL